MALSPTTWDPARTSPSINLSNGDKTAEGIGGDASAYSIYGADDGKFYWEFTLSPGSGQLVGVSVGGISTSSWPGSSDGHWAYKKSNGTIKNNTGTLQTVASGAATIGILLDATNKKLKFQRDGVDVGTEITLTGTKWYALTGTDGSTGTVTANFGASAFAYSVPSGYTSGLGLDTTPQTIAPPGVYVAKFGSPTVIRGPNRVAQVDGYFAARFGSPVLILASPQTILHAGYLAAMFGNPSAIEGPNKVLRTDGFNAASFGEPRLRLGYPLTIDPIGFLASQFGSPTLLPYADRFVNPAGFLATRFGSPVVLSDQVLPGNQRIQTEGHLAAHFGAPSLTGAVGIQALGFLAAQWGTPSLAATVKLNGFVASHFGSPSVGATVRPLGHFAPLFGQPSIRVGVRAQGFLAAKFGAPTTSAQGAVQVPGFHAAHFGTPRISGMTMRTLGGLHARFGRPTIKRPDLC